MNNVVDANATPLNSVKQRAETQKITFVGDKGAGKNQVEIGVNHISTEPPSQKWIAILAD